MLILMLAWGPLAGGLLANRIVQRPGMDYAPAFVCVSTTIRADGHMQQSRLMRRSGSLRADRHALRLTRNFKLVPQAGTPTGDAHAGERDGVFLFKIHGNGAYSFHLFDAGNPLPAICLSPFESAARDAEIETFFKG